MRVRGLEGMGEEATNRNQALERERGETTRYSMWAQSSTSPFSSSIIRKYVKSRIMEDFNYRGRLLISLWSLAAQTGQCTKRNTKTSSSQYHQHWSSPTSPKEHRDIMTTSPKNTFSTPTSPECHWSSFARLQATERLWETTPQCSDRERRS